MKLPFEEIQRTILTKKESETNPNYGKKPEDRTVTELIDKGVICINKPQGPTSHQVADYIKKIINVEKAGHGGTLDPNVTGVLPIALNKATRISQTLLPFGKEYVCLMHIHKPEKKEQIEKAFKEFLGKITQLPPIKSAVKRVEREREIYYIKILEIQDQDILFKIGCQAGTYIRRICDDVGKKLNMGAHMQQLIRTKAGPFNDKEMYSLTELQDAYTLYKEGNEKEIRKIIKPIEYSVSHLAKIWIHDSAVDPLCHGADLNLPGISKFESNIKPGELVAVLTLKNELVAIGFSKLSSEFIKQKSTSVGVQIHKTFMETETYPHYTKQAPS